MADASEEGSKRWRFTVSIFVMLFALHVVWACGYGERLGILGFARAGDFNKLNSQLDLAASASNDVRNRQLKRSIIATRIQQCNAEAKIFYTGELRQLTDEYFDLTKQLYNLPTCEELK